MFATKLQPFIKSTLKRRLTFKMDCSGIDYFSVAFPLGCMGTIIGGCHGLYSGYYNCRKLEDYTKERSNTQLFYYLLVFGSAGSAVGALAGICWGITVPLAALTVVINMIDNDYDNQHN